MTLYKGNIKVSGVGKGFSPENQGTEWQVLTKTSTGYAYQDVEALPDGGEVGNKLAKTATGSEWVDGELVEFRNNDYSAVQGPCDEGFHVPTFYEMTSLYNIMSNLGNIEHSTYAEKLHLPIAGYRESSDGTVKAQGTWCFWWTSYGHKNNSAFNAGSLRVNGNSFFVTENEGANAGGQIRPFYDGFVEPDSNWTVIQGTLGSNGIFYNATDGIISLIYGNDKVTISDKNVGATIVYNNGDTMSENNCGKFFQFGNNYGFPYTGGVTTSSTAIDASNYGPGNYYSSSTFITVNPFDTSYNINLWGGETGIIYGGKYVGEYRINEVPAEGTVGQVLTKTNEGCEYKDIPSQLPSGGTTGQVLVKTDSGYARDAVPEVSKTVNLKRTQVLSVTTQDQKSYTATGDGFIEYHCSASGGYYARNRFYYGNQMIVEVGESGDARGYIPIVKGVTVSCQRGSSSGTSEAWLRTFY